MTTHPTTTPPPATGAAIPQSPVPNRAALVGGLALLVMAIVAAWANFAVIEALVTPGDATTTARDIAASEGTFRLGITAFALVAVLDIVVAWALYVVFRPVHRTVSAAAGWIRVAYTAVLAVAVVQLPGALSGSDSEVLASVESFQDIWSAGLAVFGAHLVLIGWLAWQLGGRTRILGGLVVIAGLGYLIDSVGTMVVTDYSLDVALYTFVGELVLMVWLLLQARKRTS